MFPLAWGWGPAATVTKLEHTQFTFYLVKNSISFDLYCKCFSLPSFLLPKKCKPFHSYACFLLSLFPKVSLISKIYFKWIKSLLLLLKGNMYILLFSGTLACPFKSHLLLPILLSTQHSHFKVFIPLFFKVCVL